MVQLWHSLTDRTQVVSDLNTAVVREQHSWIEREGSLFCIRTFNVLQKMNVQFMEYGKSIYMI
jgi:hypothetical protein